MYKKGECGRTRVLRGRDARLLKAAKATVIQPQADVPQKPKGENVSAPLSAAAAGEGQSAQPAGRALKDQRLVQATTGHAAEKAPKENVPVKDSSAGEDDAPTRSPVKEQRIAPDVPDDMGAPKRPRSTRDDSDYDGDF